MNAGDSVLCACLVALATVHCGEIVVEPFVAESGGAIVRYPINEAASGVNATHLRDALEDPLDLALAYEGSTLAFTEQSGHRGLEWTEVLGDGWADGPLADTKIWRRLQGSLGATIEAVVEIHRAPAPHSTDSRIVHIGRDANSSFTLGANEGAAEFHWRSSEHVASWSVDWTPLGRVVVHLVVDTTRASAEQRVRLYLDGDERPILAGEEPYPAQDQVVDLGFDPFLAIGNRALGGRSLDGIIYYVAIYDLALPVDEISERVSELRKGDD